MERTFGWRHFRVLQKRGQGKAAYVLMAATCDEQTQFWVRGLRVRARAGVVGPMRPSQDWCAGGCMTAGCREGSL